MSNSAIELLGKRLLSLLEQNPKGLTSSTIRAMLNLNPVNYRTDRLWCYAKKWVREHNDRALLHERIPRSCERIWSLAPMVAFRDGSNVNLKAREDTIGLDLKDVLAWTVKSLGTVIRLYNSESDKQCVRAKMLRRLKASLGQSKENTELAIEESA